MSLPGSTLSLVALHAEGEIGKVLVDGAPVPPGATMEERLHALEADESLRRFCCSEPNGVPMASINLLLPPCDARADAGFIVLQPDRAHAMSGSNAICIVTMLLETERVAMHEPLTVVTLDTAAGLVRARADCAGGRCRRVTLDMPLSFVETPRLALEVPGLPPVNAAVAFGGVFYLLIDAGELGLAIEPGSSRALVEAGVRLLEAARQQSTPVHPERPAVRGLAYCMFMEERDGRLRNATVMPPGRIDRSACGTGSSARLALMHANGALDAGASMPFHSIIGSCFEAEIAGVGELAGRVAIRPRISGRAWIYGFEEWRPAEDDPFMAGHQLTDCWGPAAAGADR